MILIKTLPLFVLGFFNIVVSLLVFLRDVRKLNNLFFFGLAFSIAGWVVGIGMFLISATAETDLIWAKIFYFFPLVIAATFVFFAKTFPGYQEVSTRLLAVVCGGFLALALPLLFVPGFVTQSVAYHDWGKEIILNKTHYLLYSAYFLACAIYALGVMFKKGRTEKGIYALQASTFATGFLFTAIFGIFFNLLLPWVGNYRLIHLGPLFTSIFIIAVAYSIVRHRMFNIRLIVARSLGYVLAIFTLGWIYGLIAYLFFPKIFFPDLDLSRTQEVFFAITAVMIAITFQPLKRFFDRITNKVFYRDAYDGQALIGQLNSILVTNVDLDNITKQSAELISQKLKAEYCVFLINETAYMPSRFTGDMKKSFEGLDILHDRVGRTKQQIIITDELEDEKLQQVMRNNNISVLARLTTALKLDIEGTGYLILGEKQSGNPYNSQDIRIIRIIANEMVIAIQNALRFEEIEKFNITLQEKVDTATRQLRKTNEKLKAIDEAKDEFISMASHQLRTPLTSVKGYLSMLIEGDAGKLTPAQQQFIGQAFVSSQRMTYLISDLLNVSRLRTGKFVIDSVPANLAVVIEGEIGQLRETAESRKLKLTYDKPDNFPELMLDEVKIRQVIMNFIDNAIYYTPSGGHIQVSLSDNGQSVEFKVTDDGIGVPKAEQHQLFNKFYRAGNARKARPDGTGLGLFMAKKVVTAQGGSIIFQSQEGKGSAFGFMLPKDKLSKPESSTEAAAHSA